MSTYISPSFLAEAAVYEFVRRGNFEPNVERVSGLLGARRDAMLESLEQHFGGRATWSRPEGGYFVWLDLPGRHRRDRAARPRDRGRRAVREGHRLLPARAAAATRRRGSRSASCRRTRSARASPASPRSCPQGAVPALLLDPARRGRVPSQERRRRSARRPDSKGDILKHRVLALLALLVLAAAVRRRRDHAGAGRRHPDRQEDRGARRSRSRALQKQVTAPNEAGRGAQEAADEPERRPRGAHRRRPAAASAPPPTRSTGTWGDRSTPITPGQDLLRRPAACSTTPAGATRCKVTRSQALPPTLGAFQALLAVLRLALAASRAPRR